MLFGGRHWQHRDGVLRLVTGNQLGKILRAEVGPESGGKCHDVSVLGMQGKYGR
jgi:hypothetical protein